MHDALGDRMKDYERRFSSYVNRRGYTILRLDGKAFHTFTSSFSRPYDLDLMHAMDAAAAGVCANVEGARFAFVQSDEIQVLVTDFSSRNSGIWFDGNIQKMVSISASIATAHFNEALRKIKDIDKLAYFDSRVFQVPNKIEAFNAFLWRQQDAVRNAISMAAQNEFSHKQLHGVKTEGMLRMLEEKGVDFSVYPSGFRRGRLIEKVYTEEDIPYTHKKTGEVLLAKGVKRSHWVTTVPPNLMEDREWLLERIPE